MTLPLLDLLPNPPARLALGAFPSPLEDHPALAATFGLDRLLIKRDDLNASPFGGNKLRGLEWLLPATRPAIVTMGGYGSTWCAALAAIGLEHDRRVYPALFPQPWTEGVAATLTRTLAAASVELASSRPRLPFAVVRAWRRACRHGPVTWLPAGGATPLAVLGTVNAGLELARQVDALGGPMPEAIVVPFGSGGTAAGLLVGAWLSGWPGTICAVRVTDPWFATRRRILSLAEQTRRLLARCGLPVRAGAARLLVIDGQLGEGYGHPTGDGATAAEQLGGEGIRLDSTYSAKAGAALPGLGGSFRRICFWHTFDQRITAQPVEADPLLREARAHAESLWPLQKSI